MRRSSNPIESVRECFGLSNGYRTAAERIENAVAIHFRPIAPGITHNK